MSFLNQTPAREKWLIFTEPIFFDPNVFITREEHPFIADAKNLSNETIALPRNTMVEERIRKDYPNIKVIGTASEEEAVNLVSDRKADMTMRSLIIAAYTIKKEGLFNLKISGQIPEYTNRLRIGVLKDEKILRDILNKGVLTITPAEREAIINKHVSIKVQQGIDYVLVYKIVGVSLLLIAIAIYWNRRLAKFNAKISALQKETADALYQVEILLDNSNEGFLSFGRSLLVNKGYSKECIRMFGGRIEGKSIVSLLCEDEERIGETLQKNLIFALECDDNKRALLVLSLLPKIYAVGELSLAAKYKLLENGDMMLVLSDVTQELVLSEKIREEQSRLRFVVNIFREKELITSIVNDFRVFLADGYLQKECDRVLHTFKGHFMQYEFYNLYTAIHALEESLKAEDRSPLKSEFERLSHALEMDLQSVYEIVGFTLFDIAGSVEVDRQKLLYLSQNIETIGSNEAKEILRGFFKKPFGALLSSYPKYALELAKKSGKKLEPFLIEGDEVPVDSYFYEPFAKSLVHLFRNAIDHGVESVEERINAGKNEAAKIWVKIKKETDSIVLSIGDDGRGIDEESLIKKASKLGVEIPQNPLMLVFLDRLSTKESTSNLSGMGVGLAAVHARLTEVGGSVTVQNLSNGGCEFVFTLPLNAMKA